ncbi:cupin-like domain-containing protein [Dyella koreensis]|uniref:Cupin-like domain-containing protein n=1 Tax=Dyella koreensis TaxID=311235 RepID=A0ABW8KCV8_9GAMM
MPVPMEEFVVDGRDDVLDAIVGSERPLVMRGLVKHWPIVAAARESESAFVARLSGFDNGTPVDALLMPPGEDGVVGYSADLQHFNFRHQRVSVSQGLQHLQQFNRQEQPPALAMQSAPIAACLPGFLAEHSVPFLDAAIQPRIWIGNKVTTPAHFDEFHNIACVVSGSRRFTLFPPEQVRNLYVGPLDFAPTGAAISVARLDRPDDPRYPRLKLALEHAWVAELQPGDATYMPPMWWHHVASLGSINALVNYWWKPGLGSGLVPQTLLGCLLHCVLGFKSLPPAERKAWRELLDHYVFSDEDPAAHIPPSRRGVLGPLDAQQVAKLRETVLRYL